MNPSILLTGKNGQVGAELLRGLPQLGRVVAFGHDELDLSNPTDICRTIRQLRPELIVNAGAYTAVDQEEKEEVAAHAINAEAPGLMAKEANKIRAVLIHYSTGWTATEEETRSCYKSSDQDADMDPTLPYRRKP